MSLSPAKNFAGRIAAAVLLAGVTAGTGDDANAGSIGFRTDAEVTAGPGVDVKVTLTNTGDEAASDVTVRAELLGAAVDGEKVATMNPGKDHVWNIHLFDEVARGVYAIALRTRYADANGYPFEVVSLATASVGVKAAPRLFGNLDVPPLATDGAVVARLNVKKPPGRSGSFEVRLIAPGGIAVSPEKATLVFDESDKAVAEFSVRNSKLLAGTTVNVFGFVSGSDPGFPQIDSIRGSVRIVAAVTRIKASMFYQAAAAVAGLLLLCEGIAWAAARRTPGN